MPPGTAQHRRRGDPTDIRAIETGQRAFSQLGFTVTNALRGAFIASRRAKKTRFDGALHISF
jgi:hypothetical protein